VNTRQEEGQKEGPGDKKGELSIAASFDLFGIVLRPEGTDKSNPAIYRRVRNHMGLRPGGMPEYRCAINSKDIVLQSRYRVSLETDIFFLEASEPMMLRLILEIGNRFRNIRDTP
jgi:hypothetical protein